MADTLKPCPHCGNDEQSPIESVVQLCHNEWHPEHNKRGDWWTVQCDGCTATMGQFYDPDEAIAAWNTRTIDDAPDVDWDANYRTNRDLITRVATDTQHFFEKGMPGVDIARIAALAAQLTLEAQPIREVEAMRSVIIKELQDATDVMGFDLGGNDFAYCANRIIAALASKEGEA
jgi:hypothetical protein